MRVALGLDLGGTALKYGLVSEAGKLLSFASRPSRARRGSRAIASTMREAVAELLRAAEAAGHEPVAVGAGVPGTVGGAAGRLITEPPQLPGSEGLAFGTVLRRASGLPCEVENDASAAGFAEARVGAGRGKPNVLTVTVGTGLGAGLVVHGRLVRGRYGTAGEIGHAVFVPPPPGRLRKRRGRERFERHASATALLRIYRELGGPRSADPAEIAARAERGERRAARAFHVVGTNLGFGLVNAALLVAPDVIAIGGGLAAAGELLLAPARAAFESEALPYLTRGCRITTARLGNRAGVLGAALLALHS